MGRRAHIATDYVFHLLGKGGVAGCLERAQAMGLETMGRPYVNRTGFAGGHLV